MTAQERLFSKQAHQNECDMFGRLEATHDIFHFHHFWRHIFAKKYTGSRKRCVCVFFYTSPMAPILLHQRNYRKDTPPPHVLLFLADDDRLARNRDAAPGFISWRTTRVHCWHDIPRVSRPPLVSTRGVGENHLHQNWTWSSIPGEEPVWAYAVYR